MSKYATFENNAPKYAPYAVQIGSHTRVTDSLTEAEANGVGLKLVVDAPPETDAEHYAAPTGWENGDRITRTYEIREVETPVRQWTPLSIKRACGDKWATVKAALETAGIYDEFLMAQYLAEDDPSFEQGYEWACQQYGKEAVDTILDAAEVEA